MGSIAASKVSSTFHTKYPRKILNPKIGSFRNYARLFTISAKIVMPKFDKKIIAEHR